MDAAPVGSLGAEAIDCAIDGWGLRLRMANLRDGKNMVATMKAVARGCRWSNARDATAASLTDFLIADNPRTGKPLSSSRKNNILSVVSGFLEYAVIEGKAARNIAKDLPRAQGGRGKGARAFSADEIVRLVAVARRHEQSEPSCRGTMRSSVYLVAALTGLREGELRGLCVRHINLDGEPPRVEIPGTLSKAKRDEAIPIHTGLLPTIVELCRERDPDERLFHTMPGNGTIENDMRRAGILKIDARGRVASFHSFRKSFVTLLSANGAQARSVQELARHSDPRLTHGTYTDGKLLPVAQELSKLPNLAKCVESLLANPDWMSQNLNAELPMLTHFPSETSATGSVAPEVQQSHRAAEPVARASGIPGLAASHQSHLRDLNPGLAGGASLSTLNQPVIVSALIAGLRAFTAALERGGVA